jgi:pyruvate dehydrogenase E2 component (dihydrolipoamide acetyltransferase)
LAAPRRVEEKAMPDVRIKPIVMPKWGLTMTQGKVTSWHKNAGDTVAVGDEILEVETDKIASAVEASDAGRLRRVLGEVDAVYPVKALIGVLADDDVSDEEIDAYVASYVTPAAEGGEGEGAAGPQYKFVETVAGRIRYAKRGERGDAVILVHGFGGDLDNWLFNIDALAEKATVYALDLPGHGQSSKAIADASLAGLSHALIGLMDALGIANAHIVGHSVGGVVAMQTALDAPDRVKSLTLICSAGLGSEINGAYIDGYVTATSRRDLRPVLEQLFADPKLVSRQLVDDALKYKRLDGVAEALSSLQSNLIEDGKQRTNLAQAFERLACPVLVIWGEQDNIIPAAHARAVADRVRTEIIPGAGHMVQMEKAGRINELILAHMGA